MLTQAGNSSNLILDPDLDSFYVMDAQIVQLPKALLAAIQAANPDRHRAALRRRDTCGAGGHPLVGRGQPAQRRRHRGGQHPAGRDQGPARVVQASTDAISALAATITASLDRPGASDPAASALPRAR